MKKAKEQSAVLDFYGAVPQALYLPLYFACSRH